LIDYEFSYDPSPSESLEILQDKLIWKERIEWVENNIDTLDVIDAEDPFGAIASINALKQIN
jgi:hypothetical protein